MRTCFGEGGVDSPLLTPSGQAAKPPGFVKHRYPTESEQCCSDKENSEMLLLTAQAEKHNLGETVKNCNASWELTFSRKFTITAVHSQTQYTADTFIKQIFNEECLHKFSAF